MPRLMPYTEQEIAAVEKHLAYCLTAARRGLDNAIRQCDIVEDKRTLGQRTYWQNVVSGIKWCQQQLTYRKESTPHGEQQSVQFPGTDSSPRRGDWTGDSDSKGCGAG